MRLNPVGVCRLIVVGPPESARAFLDAGILSLPESVQLFRTGICRDGVAEQRDSNCRTPAGVGQGRCQGHGVLRSGTVRKSSERCRSSSRRNQTS